MEVFQEQCFFFSLILARSTYSVEFFRQIFNNGNIMKYIEHTIHSQYVLLLVFDALYCVFEVLYVATIIINRLHYDLGVLIYFLAHIAPMIVILMFPLGLFDILKEHIVLSITDVCLGLMMGWIIYHYIKYRRRYTLIDRKTYMC